MKKMVLGKIVNTHGIKGEVRILSDLKEVSTVLNVGNEVMIGDQVLVVNTYRVHKNYHMISFKGLDNINDVLKYKGKNVFFDRDKVTFSKPYIVNDLIEFDAYFLDKKIGKIVDFMYNSTNLVLIIAQEKKNIYIPYQEYFIFKVDLEKKLVEFQNIEDLI